MPIPAKRENERQKTARERVYSELRNWIIDGTLQPEEKISDYEISQYFSVSRTPVREAIKMLADQKLVNIFPGKETKIAPINMPEARTNYRLLAELHALALEMAYPKLTEEHIKELKRINHSFSIAEKRCDVEITEILDNHFHDIFLHLSGSPFFMEFSNILKIHIMRIENIYYKKNDIVSFQSHEEIIQALENHDLEGAKNAMRINWIHTVAEVLEVL